MGHPLGELWSPALTNMNDTYIEHKFHDTYQADCSTCYSESRLIKAYKTVNIPKIEMPPKNWVNHLMNHIIGGHFYD